MRNLKRVLSLALATVMLLGMMVMSTGAANVSDFTDADEITNLEAASVTTAIDIFSGYGDGSFGGENYVNRAEMATIICKILLGSKVNADIYKGLGSFQDLAGYEWAEGYINMCHGQGIVNGTSTTTYEPGRPVRTWEAALMLQRALGWWDKNDPLNATISELTVSNKSGGLGLYGNLTLNANDYLTRNDVAEMVFNAITKCVPVEYNESFSLYRNASSPNIFSGVVFNYVDTLAYQTFGLVYSQDREDVFGRPAITWGYGKLNTTSGSSDIDSDGNIDPGYLGLTRELVTVAKTPVLEYTSTVNGRTLYNALGLRSSSYNTLPLVIDGRELSTSKHMDSTTHTEVNDDLSVTVSNTSSPLVTNDADPLGFTGNGVLTQVFEIHADDPTTEPEYKVVVINTYLMKVNQTYSATRTSDAYVTVGMTESTAKSNYPYRSVEFDTRYDTADFAKEDVVLVTVALADKEAMPSNNNKYEIQSMELAEAVDGTMTRFTQKTNTMAVDGVTYSFSKKATKDANEYNQGNTGSIGLPVTIYMDKYGYAIQVDGSTSTMTNYALVLAVDTDNSAKFEENNAWAKLLLTDGSIIQAKIEWSDDPDTDGQWTYSQLGNLNTSAVIHQSGFSYDALGNQEDSQRAWMTQSGTKESLITNVQTLVTYSVNKDGVYTLYKLKTDGIDDWSGITTDNNRSRVRNYSSGSSKDLVYTNDNTVMIVRNSYTRDDYSIFVGVKKLPDLNAAHGNYAAGLPYNSASKTTQVAFKSGNLATVIYTEAPLDRSTNDLIYLAKQGAWYYDTDGGACVPFTAIINGEVREIIVEGQLYQDGSVGMVKPKNSDIKAGGFYKSMTEKDGIVTAMVGAVEGDDYQYGSGYRAIDAGVFGAGWSGTTWVTWKNDAPVAYVTKSGVTVAYNTDINSLYDDKDAHVYYGKSTTGNEGELTWLIVVDGSVASTIPGSSIGGGAELTVDSGSQTLNGNVDGDLTVESSASATVKGDVSGNVTVTSGTVTIEGTVKKDAVINAATGTNLTLNNVEAGAKITVCPGTTLKINGTQNEVITVVPNGSSKDITPNLIQTSLPEGVYFVAKTNVDSGSQADWDTNTVAIVYDNPKQQNVTLTITQVVDGNTTNKYENTWNAAASDNTTRRIVRVSLDNPYSPADFKPNGGALDYSQELDDMKFTGSTAPISILVTADNGETVLFSATITPVTSDTPPAP